MPGASQPADERTARSFLPSPTTGKSKEGYEEFMAGVGRNYDAARDSAGWTWSEAQRAAKERWGATKSATKETWDQVGDMCGGQVPCV